VGGDPVASEGEAGDVETATEEEWEEEICEERDERFEEEGEGGDASGVVPEEVFFVVGLWWRVNTEVCSHINFSCICCVPY